MKQIVKKILGIYNLIMSVLFAISILLSIQQGFPFYLYAIELGIFISIASSTYYMLKK